MIKYLPVYSKLGAKVEKTEHGACVKNKVGTANWTYDGRMATGRGIYICGTARSGTMYITKLLCGLGYDIGHELVEKDGSVGYHLVVIKPENCLHQVRHPLSQIASMKVHQSWGFMEDIINLPGRGLLGCMTYWLEWNELIEDIAVWRYRIEDLPNVWDEFLERIGHKKCPVPDTPKNENSSTKGGYCERKRYKKLIWDDLFACNRKLAQDIYDKAKKYGYSPKGQRVSTESRTTLVA